MQDQPQLRVCDGPEKDCFVGLAVAYSTCSIRYCYSVSHSSSSCSRMAYFSLVK